MSGHQDIVVLNNPVTGRPIARATAEYLEAVTAKADRWVPANGGLEEPCTAKSGREVLYVYNPATGQHGYLDLDTDIVWTGRDVAHLLGE